MKNLRKPILNQIIAHRPDAVLVKNKYKVLCGMIKKMYPNNYEKLSPQIWEKIIYEVVNGDRDLRLLTEGQDKETKIIKSQSWIVENLMK